MSKSCSVTLRLLWLVRLLQSARILPVAFEAGGWVCGEGCWCHRGLVPNWGFLIASAYKYIFLVSGSKTYALKLMRQNMSPLWLNVGSWKKYAPAPGKKNLFWFLKALVRLDSSAVRFLSDCSK